MPEAPESEVPTSGLRGLCIGVWVEGSSEGFIRASQAVDMGLLRSRHDKGVFFQLGLDSWGEELPVKHAFYAEV